MTVDDYIAAYPAEIQERLQQIRSIVFEYAPEALEYLSYDMPAYKLNGRQLLYFAAFKQHIGVYAMPECMEAFERELATYRHGKGSIQFPYNQPLPLDLFRQIVEFRVWQTANAPKKK
ncbi:MAG: DUF1801 domain-containing protein [Tannerella sp.]|jgi:uncharacterized protein YdhG (YjbR/CyaY superfamily)|nr:DUF1801 domain-containing protein [Tannerella sp.]